MNAGIFLGVAHHQFHVHQLARIAVRVVHHIYIPHAVIVIGNVDDFLIQIKGHSSPVR